MSDFKTHRPWVPTLPQLLPVDETAVLPDPRSQAIPKGTPNRGPGGAPAHPPPRSEGGARVTTPAQRRQRRVNGRSHLGLHLPLDQCKGAADEPLTPAQRIFVDTLLADITISPTEVCRRVDPSNRHPGQTAHYWLERTNVQVLLRARMDETRDLLQDIQYRVIQELSAMGMINVADLYVTRVYCEELGVPDGDGVPRWQETILEPHEYEARVAQGDHLRRAEYVPCARPLETLPESLQRAIVGVEVKETKGGRKVVTYRLAKTECVRTLLEVFGLGPDHNAVRKASGELDKENRPKQSMTFGDVTIEF